MLDIYSLKGHYPHMENQLGKNMEKITEYLMDTGAIVVVFSGPGRWCQNGGS